MRRDATAVSGKIIYGMIIRVRMGYAGFGWLEKVAARFTRREEVVAGRNNIS